MMSARVFTVLVKERGGREVAYTFDRRSVTVGRGVGNDVVLPRRRVADRHLSIFCKDRSFVVTDLHTSHGTWVRGRRLSQPVVLASMEPIEVGDFRLRCHLGGVRSASAHSGPREARWSTDLMETQQRLERLRGLLYGEKTESGWSSLCALLDEWPEDEDLSVALDYAESLLESWPDRLRRAPDVWKRPLLMGRASNPRFRVIKRLDLSYAVMEARVIGQLRWKPWLSQLTMLTLRRSFMEDSEVEALIGLESLRSLRHLDLGYNRIGDDGVAMLSQAPWAGSLEHLNLEGNPISGPGVHPLLRSPSLSKLASLNLSDVWAGAQVSMALLAGRLPALRELRLSAMKLGPDQAHLLAQAPCLEHLDVLELSQNLLGDEGVNALSQAPRRCALRSLDLSSNGVSDVGALSLASSRAFSGLTTLRLSGNALSEHAIQALANSRMLPRLDVLEV